MGLFNVTVRLANLSVPSQAGDVSLLVGTRATLSWIPREILDRLGVAPVSRLPFTLADGRLLERDITAVLLTVDGRKAPVEVAFGEPGEEAVLGATALEGLGFMVDPVAQKLVPRNLFALSNSVLGRAGRAHEGTGGPRSTNRLGMSFRINNMASWLVDLTGKHCDNYVSTR